MINAYAWKLQKEQDYLLYRIQIEGIDKKNKHLLKTFSEWRECGSGYRPVTSSQIVVMDGKFSSQSQFQNFLSKEVDFKVLLVTDNGESTLKKTHGTRRCGKCGKTGHNIRRCTFQGAEAKKNLCIKGVKKKKCGKCGNLGHNSRTCKN